MAYQTAPATGMSMRWPMLALCAGGVLMFLNTLVVMIEDNSWGLADANPRDKSNLDGEVS